MEAQDKEKRSSVSLTGVAEEWVMSGYCMSMSKRMSKNWYLKTENFPESTWHKSHIKNV